ncbi:RNA polymerase sigma factor [Piscinibacter sakaiensis]|uniref:RNA polymerase sigma factor n=1 Tax=Piscinibacter sakaiensis TaxID=1547922 RepID=UPI003AAD5D0D
MGLSFAGRGTLFLAPDRLGWRAGARRLSFDVHRRALSPMASKLPPAYVKLLRWLMRRGDSKPDAEDRLHDAWIRLAEYAQNHHVEQPEAFLRKVSLHLLIDARRERSARGEEVELDEEIVASAAPSVEQTLIDREQATEVAGVLLDQDDKTWEIVLDSRMYGMTYSEIALKHGVSISTVERRVAKATLLISEWKKRRKP